MPAARPRVGRWGTYYPKTYKLWMEAAHNALTKLEATPTDGAISVFVDVVCEPFKTVDRPFPKGDADNYLKAVLDVITKAKIAWDDDKQIVEMYVVKRFPEDGETPHSRITIQQLFLSKEKK